MLRNRIKIRMQSNKSVQNQSPKKYEVTFYYSGNYITEVQANDENDAYMKALTEFNNHKVSEIDTEMSSSDVIVVGQ